MKHRIAGDGAFALRDGAAVVERHALRVGEEPARGAHDRVGRAGVPQLHVAPRRMAIELDVSRRDLDALDAGAPDRHELAYVERGELRVDALAALEARD